MSITIPNEVTVTEYPRYDGPREFLTVGERNLAVRDIVRMLDELVDGNVMTPDERHEYFTAVMGHYYHGILPGFQRFTLPRTNVRLYFLPALRVLWDNYVLPGDEIMSIRLDWLRGGDGWSNHNPDWVVTARRDGFVVDEAEEMIDFNGIFDDLDAINHMINNPERAVSPLGVDEFEFDPAEIPVEDYDAALVIHNMWMRNDADMTEPETDDE